MTSGSVSREIERGVSRARVERDREGRGSCFFEQLGLGYVSPPTFHIGLIKSQPTSLLAPPLLIFSLPCLLSCSFPSRTSTIFIFVHPPFLISAPPLICILLLYFFFLYTPSYLLISHPFLFWTCLLLLCAAHIPLHIPLVTTCCTPGY